MGFAELLFNYKEYLSRPDSYFCSRGSFRILETLKKV